jgi:hypothetical protein
MPPAAHQHLLARNDRKRPKTSGVPPAATSTQAAGGGGMLSTWMAALQPGRKP